MPGPVDFVESGGMRNAEIHIMAAIIFSFLFLVLFYVCRWSFFYLFTFLSIEQGSTSENEEGPSMHYTWASAEKEWRRYQGRIVSCLRNHTRRAFASGSYGIKGNPLNPEAQKP